MRIAIVQARMGSERLPGKVLADVAGQPMLQRVVNRLRLCRQLDSIIVATTPLPEDAPIVKWCRRSGVAWSRGHATDVLDRYYQAAMGAGATRVIRVTADCPLIDPEVLDQVAVRLEDGPFDYACNFYPRRTFPRGLDVEAMTLATLRRVWNAVRLPQYREHVTLAIYQNPQRFRIGAVHAPTSRADLRWTVDTPQDLQLVREIYGHFGRSDFGWQEVIRAYKHHPQWCDVNRSIPQKKVV